MQIFTDKRNTLLVMMHSYKSAQLVNLNIDLVRMVLIESQ